MQRVRKAVFGAHEVGESVDPGYQRFAGFQTCGQLVRGLDTVTDLVLNDGQDEIRSAWKMPV